MEDVILFHVTFDCNLAGIKDKEGLVPGGNENGLGKALDLSESIAEDAKDKIFLSMEALSMLPYIVHLKAMKDDDRAGDENPVILRIKIPLDEFADFEILRDENEVSLGEDIATNSWYFTNPVPIKYIDIATTDNPDGPWLFKPLADFDLDEESTTLVDLFGDDLPHFPDFDMDEETKEELRQSLEQE